MIWKRITNLWYWSKLSPPRDAYFESEQGKSLIVRNVVNNTKQSLANVIPYKSRNPVKEIVGDEKAI